MRVLTWTGELTLFGLRAIRDAFRRPLEGQEIFRQVYEVGWRSLPLIAAAGFAVGVVLSMHTRASLERFGAEALIPADQSDRRFGDGNWNLRGKAVGVEGNFMTSDISGSRKYNAGLNKVAPGFDSLADLRLRAGYTVLPNLLLFGTFGGAWADADLPITGPGGGFRDTTFFGWSAGGGAEFAFDENWSARFDYQFTDFDAETISYPGGKETFDPDSNTFRGSLIYRF